jgi:hypothetical protein
MTREILTAEVAQDPVHGRPRDGVLLEPGSHSVFTGRWRNERGSEMVLRQDGNAISGVYVSRVGDEKALGREQELTGFATGELIGFVVCWSASESLTSWVGRLVRGDANWTLHTVWHLGRQWLEGEPRRGAEVWETFLTNTSVFTKISGPTE